MFSPTTRLAQWLYHHQTFLEKGSYVQNTTLTTERDVAKVPGLRVPTGGELGHSSTHKLYFK